jgi:hypothetical protein
VTTPETWQGSPKVNFPCSVRVSKVKRAVYGAAKSLYLFQQSGVGACRFRQASSLKHARPPPRIMTLDVSSKLQVPSKLANHHTP